MKEKMSNSIKGSIIMILLFTIGCADKNKMDSDSYTQNENKQMVRLAKLVIDSTQLESYYAFLKEEIETSISVEPGVLTLYAVAEKGKPTHITILEIYANVEAYKNHIQTPHFLKYKDGTKDMVRKLELVEAIPLIPGMKIK